MLTWLFDYLTQYYSGFNVFRYLTLRAILGLLTALLLCLFVGPLFIRRLSRHRVAQTVRGLGPESHGVKSGTPTMGGLMILFSLLFSTLCWADPGNRFVQVAIATTVLFGLIGLADDYGKVRHGRAEAGLAAWQKYLWQSMAGLAVALFLFFTAQAPSETQLIVPFVKQVAIDMGWLYVLLAYFVIVGTSNAVNLTDGLDGLAILPIVLIAGALAVFAYLGGNARFAQYLGIPHVPGSGELAIFCGAVMGAGLGFLWFNTYPAQVFMGDIGALSLGAALGAVAVMVRQEFVLFIMGGLFVLETVSVILQVASCRLTGQRLFRMAPLHHHLELKGWPEPKIIVRLWIVTVILVLIGLSSLKIR